MKPSKSFCRQHRCCLSSIKTREILDESHSFFLNVFFMTLQRWLHIFQTWTEEDPWKILFLWFCWNKAKPFQPWATKTEIHAKINGCHLSQKKRIASVIEIVDLRKLPSFLESCVTIDESLVTTEIHYSTSMQQIQPPQALHGLLTDRWLQFAEFETAGL